MITQSHILLLLTIRAPLILNCGWRWRENTIRAEMYGVADINIPTYITEHNICVWKAGSPLHYHYVLLTQPSFFFTLLKGIWSVGWFCFVSFLIAVFAQLVTGSSNRPVAHLINSAFSHGRQENSLLVQHPRWESGRDQFWEFMNQNSSCDLSMDAVSLKWIMMEFKL